MTKFSPIRWKINLLNAWITAPGYIMVFGPEEFVNLPKNMQFKIQYFCDRIEI